jgi:hypothetical protein
MNNYIELTDNIKAFEYTLIDGYIKLENVFMIDDRLIKKGCIVTRLPIEQKIGILGHSRQDFFYVIKSNIGLDNQLIIAKSATAYKFSDNEYFVSEDNILLATDGDKFKAGNSYHIAKPNDIYKGKELTIELLDGDDIIIVKEIVGTILSDS